jgi:hypothetical protein
MEKFIRMLKIGFCVSHLRVQRKFVFAHTLICEDFALFPGTEILTVQAADNDDPKTDNVTALVPCSRWTVTLGSSQCKQATWREPPHSTH